MVLEKIIESPLDCKEIKSASSINPEYLINIFNKYIKSEYSINLEYVLEGLRLKLKLQYSGHVMQKADSLEKAPMLGMIEGNEGNDEGEGGSRG